MLWVALFTSGCITSYPNYLITKTARHSARSHPQRLSAALHKSNDCSEGELYSVCQVTGRQTKTNTLCPLVLHKMATGHNSSATVTTEDK